MRKSLSFKQKLGRRLMKLRKRAELSRLEIADGMGLTGCWRKQGIRALELGLGAEPGLGVVWRYLRACGAMVYELADVVDSVKLPRPERQRKSLTAKPRTSRIGDSPGFPKWKAGTVPLLPAPEAKALPKPKSKSLDELIRELRHGLTPEEHEYNPYWQVMSQVLHRVEMWLANQRPMTLREIPLYKRQIQRAIRIFRMGTSPKAERERLRMIQDWRAISPERLRIFEAATELAIEEWQRLTRF